MLLRALPISERDVTSHFGGSPNKQYPPPPPNTLRRVPAMPKKLSMAALFVLSLLPLYFFPPASAATYISFPLMHRDAQASPIQAPEATGALPAELPLRDFLAAGLAMRARAERQSSRRARGVAAAVAGQFSYLNENVGDFYLTASVGSPPQKLIFTLDTGSELTWTDCTPCKICSSSGGPSFAFNKSSSYKAVPCSSPLCSQSLGFAGGCSNLTGLCIFQLQYGDGSADAGYISVDSFHLSESMSKQIVFGCAVIDLDTVPVPTSGIMGLNAAPFSFTTQLLGQNPRLAKKFAYCLPDRFENLNSQGTILFGNYRLPSQLKYTPFTPPFGPIGELYYFVKLEGISVGDKFIKSTVKQEGLQTTGTIFDSGTAVTHLMSPLYEDMVVELRRQTQSLHPFSMNGTVEDVCYRVSLKAQELPALPTITMHFAGKVEMALGPDSVLYPAGYDDKGIALCLAFTSFPGNTSFNIIGNYQQQNYWVEYNLQASRLGLAKANCVTKR